MADTIFDGSKQISQSAPAFLTGQRVSLRSLELTDLDALWTWFADREVVQYSLSMWLLPFSRHETQLWLEKIVMSILRHEWEATDAAATTAD